MKFILVFHFYIRWIVQRWKRNACSLIFAFVTIQRRMTQMPDSIINYTIISICVNVFRWMCVCQNARPHTLIIIWSTKIDVFHFIQQISYLCNSSPRHIHYFYLSNSLSLARLLFLYLFLIFLSIVTCVFVCFFWFCWRARALSVVGFVAYFIRLYAENEIDERTFDRLLCLKKMSHSKYKSHPPNSKQITQHTIILQHLTTIIMKQLITVRSHNANAK